MFIVFFFRVHSCKMYIHSDHGLASSLESAYVLWVGSSPYYHKYQQTFCTCLDELNSNFLISINLVNWNNLVTVFLQSSKLRAQTVQVEETSI